MPIALTHLTTKTVLMYCIDLLFNQPLVWQIVMALLAMFGRA